MYFFNGWRGICGLNSTNIIKRIVATTNGSLRVDQEAQTNVGFLKARANNIAAVAGVSTTVYTFTANDLPYFTVTNTGANAAWVNFTDAAALGVFMQLPTLVSVTFSPPQFIMGGGLTGMTVNIFSTAGTTVTVATVRNA